MLEGQQDDAKAVFRAIRDFIAALKFVLEGHHQDGKAVYRAIRDFLNNKADLRIERQSLLKQYSPSLSQVYQGMVIIDYYLLGRKHISAKKLPPNNPK